MSTTDSIAAPAALSVSRAEAAMRALPELIADRDRLTTLGLRFFGDLAAAQESCREQAGVMFDLELEPGLAAWFSSWKTSRAGDKGRELARADADADRRPREA